MLITYAITGIDIGEKIIMPYYDLRCPKCDNEYTISAPMKDKIEKLILCPDCESPDLETVYKAAPWVRKSSSKPLECPNSHTCGANCRHAA